MGSAMTKRSRIQHSTFNIQHSVYPLLTAALLILIWSLSVHLTATKIFPSPTAVAKGIVQLAQRGQLWSYTVDPLARAFNPLIQMLRPISPLAWMPLAVIWFGIGNAAPIFLIFIASLFPIVIAAARSEEHTSELQSRV